jgi:ubiquinol-cytochrome c reductase cytochrome c subunit
MRRARRAALATAALGLATFAAGSLASPPSQPPPETSKLDRTGPGSTSAARSPLAEEGQSIFEEGCSSCHGFTGKGVEGRGPSLIGAGAAAADFYLRTGRMPLNQVGDEPLRSPPHYPGHKIRALVAYVGSLGKGPAIPTVDPEEGSLSEGLQLFGESCAGCHGIGGKGGVAIGGYAPPLGAATPRQVGEAIRVGPYLMPRFSEAQLSDEEVDSIARYVELTKEPDDAGGWGIGHIGPVPEGLIAWLAAIAAILLVARLIGERGAGGPRAREPRR